LTNERELDYDKINQEHRQILQRIKNTEENKTEDPTEAITMSFQLANKMEACSEYVEDPDNKLARNEHGQLLRCKLKITLSYSPGANPSGCPHFKGV
jgi:hypothetical protein